MVIGDTARGPSRKGNRKCGGISICRKGQPSQYGWKRRAKWGMNWSECEHTRKITLEYLKGNFTAKVLADVFSSP